MISYYTNDNILVGGFNPSEKYYCLLLFITVYRSAPVLCKRPRRPSSPCCALSLTERVEGRHFGSSSQLLACNAKDDIVQLLEPVT